MKLCKAGCDVRFTKFDIGVEVRYRGRLILTGSKCTSTGLWIVPREDSPKTSPTPCARTCGSVPFFTSSLPDPSSEQYLANTTQTSSQAEVAMYHHQAMGLPPKSTFFAAIHKHPELVSTFPGLTYDLINKHLPSSTATIKGNMIQNRKGLRSTSSDPMSVMDAQRRVSDMSPVEQICSAKEDEICCFAVISNRNKNTNLRGLTGQFPVQSYK